MRRWRLSPEVAAVLPRSRLESRRCAAALNELIRSMHVLASRGGSILTELLGPGPVPGAWTHTPVDDAHDVRSGYRWYYHAHPRHGHGSAEHGHFHLFADRRGTAEVTHLLAISVDGRGVPLGLVAPNRWVTGEHWRPAPSVQRLVEHFTLSTPRRLLHVHRWLKQVLVAFTPQVRALLKRRDARASDLRTRLGRDILDDRRITVLSRCRVNLQSQAELLERSLDLFSAQSAR